MRKIILVTLIIIVTMIWSLTTFKVLINHHSKLHLVTDKRITEAAFKCVNEHNCDNYPVTLKQLYDNKYLTNEINPVTKEYYNENSYVTIKEDKLTFVVVN